jgi:hypothetical protein
MMGDQLFVVAGLDRCSAGQLVDHGQRTILPGIPPAAVALDVSVA